MQNIPAKDAADNDHGQAEPPLRIDLHVHLVSMDRDRGVMVSRRMRRDPLYRALMLKYGFPLVSDNEIGGRYVNRLVKELRESRTTDKAVLLALDGVCDPAGRLDPGRTHEHIPNHYCAEICAEHEELLFGASVNPMRARALDELERVAGLGAVLIKWLPPSQGFDPADRAFIPFYDKLVELGLPLLTHTGYEHCLPACDQMTGDPGRLRLALDRGVRVVAAHAGTAGVGHPIEFFDSYLDLLGEYDNLYGDLAALTGLSRFVYVQRMLRAPGFMDRHFHATDYPVPALPLLFAPRIGLGRALELSLEGNLFDRDAELKRSLGFPEKVFTSAAGFLGL